MPFIIFVSACCKNKAKLNFLDKGRY